VGGGGRRRREEEEEENFDVATMVITKTIYRNRWILILTTIMTES
jgi:hypothetical protein